MSSHPSPNLNRLRAVVLLLAVVLPLHAETMAEAIRQLASVVPARSRVALAIENRAGLDEAQVQEFRKALIEQMSPVEVADDGQPLRIVLSDNVRGLLAIALFGQRTVLVPWTVSGAAPRRPRAKIAATPVWSQSDPVLDTMLTSSAMLVLEPARVVLYRKSGEGWQFERGAALAWAMPMPRDPRGRLTGTLDAFHVLTPSGTCGGTAVPSLSVTCGDTGVANPWLPGRNLQKHAVLGEFYSAAELPDGRAITATPGARGTGSQVAAIRSACGVTWLTADASTGETDIVTGMTTSGIAATDPLNLDGVVTELWSSDSGVTAVVSRPGTHRYETLLLAIRCPE